jgi:hypothetical protein
MNKTEINIIFRIREAMDIFAGTFNNQKIYLIYQMQDKLKNAITISVTILALIPFVLLTDLFPFFRFGMFAEPLKSSIQTELFQVITISDKGKEEVFNPDKMGINSADFNYLCRNYYYRREGEIFLKNISKAYDIKDVKEWIIQRTFYTQHKKDSARVARITIHP